MNEGGAGGARFDRFGGNRVGRGGENLGEIDQIVKLFYFTNSGCTRIYSTDFGSSTIHSSTEDCPFRYKGCSKINNLLLILILIFNFSAPKYSSDE